MKENIINRNYEFKQIEKSFETVIAPWNHIIVRLDGHKFSKFTKKLRKPYDEILGKVMVNTMVALVDKFNANLGFTGSDEITLYFPKPENEKQTHPFAGRTQKMASLLSAFATKEFNAFWEIETIHYKDYGWDLKYLDTLISKRFEAFFDARVYGVESLKEVFDNFKWRNHDVFRNAKTGFAQAYCSHKELQGKTANEQIALTYEKTDKSFGESPEWFKYGTFCKKELYMKETASGVVERSRIRTWSELLEDYKSELFDKYINEEEFRSEDE